MDAVEVRLRTDVRGLVPRSADGAWHLSKARLRLIATRLAPHPSDKSAVYMSLRAEPAEQEPNRAFRWELLARLWLHSDSDLRCLAHYRFPLTSDSLQYLQFPKRYLRLQDNPKLDLHLTFLRKEDFLLPDFTRQRHPDDLPITLRMNDGSVTTFHVSPHILRLHSAPDGRLAQLLDQGCLDWTNEFQDSKDLGNLLLQLYPTRAEPPLGAVPALAKLAVHLGLPALRSQLSSYILQCKDSPVSWKLMVADAAGMVETVCKAALGDPYEAAELARAGMADFLSDHGGDALLGSLAECRQIFPDPLPMQMPEETEDSPANILLQDRNGSQLLFSRDWLSELIPNLPKDCGKLMFEDLAIFRAILSLNFQPQQTVPEQLVRPILEWCGIWEAKLVRWQLEDQLVCKVVPGMGKRVGVSGRTQTGTESLVPSSDTASMVLEALALGEELELGRLQRSVTDHYLRGNSALLANLRAFPDYHRLSHRTRLMVMEAVGGEKVGSADVRGLDPPTHFHPSFHLVKPPNSELPNHPHNSH